MNSPNRNPRKYHRTAKQVLEIALSERDMPDGREPGKNGRRHYVSSEKKKVNGIHKTNGDVAPKPELPANHDELNWLDAQTRTGMKDLARGMTRYCEMEVSPTNELPTPEPEPAPEVLTDVPVNEAGKTPLRLLVKSKLEKWSAGRTYEARRLSELLVVWATSMADQEKTVWELVEDQIILLTINKTSVENARPEQGPSTGAKHKSPEPVSTEKIINWLFEAPTAQEWMGRFKRRFERERRSLFGE